MHVDRMEMLKDTIALIASFDFDPFYPEISSGTEYSVGLLATLYSGTFCVASKAFSADGLAHCERFFGFGVIR